MDGGFIFSLKGMVERMYKKVPTTLDFVSREGETLKFWKENKIFEKSLKLREG